MHSIKTIGTATTLLASGFIATAHAAPAPFPQKAAYTCQDNKALNVQFVRNKVGKVVGARAHVEGRKRTFRVDNKAVNADVYTTFRSGRYSLMVDQDQKGASLTRSGTSVVNGKRMPVDRILYKACAVKG